MWDLGLDATLLTTGLTGSALQDEFAPDSGETLGLTLLTVAPTIYYGLSDRFFVEGGFGYAFGSLAGQAYTVEDGSLNYFNTRALESISQSVTGTITVLQGGWRIDPRSNNHFRFFYRYVPIVDSAGRQYYFSIQGIAFTFLFGKVF